MRPGYAVDDGPFDVETGQPVSRVRTEEIPQSWYDHACAYVDMKWPRAAGKSRQGIAESLATVTPALLVSGKSRPGPTAMRALLYGCSFNARARAAGPPPEELVRAPRWLAANTRPVCDLADPAVLRPALDAVALRLDGKLAAASTVSRKRAIFYNAVEYAVELGHLSGKPVASIKWRAPKVTEAVNPRVVINHGQAREQLDAVQALRERPTPHSAEQPAIRSGPMVVEVLVQERGQLRGRGHHPDLLRAPVLQLARLPPGPGLTPRAPGRGCRRAQAQLSPALRRERQGVLPEIDSLSGPERGVVHDPEERDQAPADRLQVGRGGRAALHERARATLGADAPGEHDLFRRLADALAQFSQLGLVEQTGRQGKDALDIGVARARTHDAGAGLAPKQQIESVGQHRLAGAGLPGDRGQARAGTQLGALDQQQVLDP
jgi:hypothetical protein